MIDRSEIIRENIHYYPEEQSMQKRMMLRHIVIEIAYALGGRIKNEKSRIKTEKLDKINDAQ